LKIHAKRVIVGVMQVHTATQTLHWVTEKEYARLHGLSRQTLTNWRYRDRRAGRREAPAGYPQYKYFGQPFRYRMEGS
jgi:hypothetical protein